MQKLAWKNLLQNKCPKCGLLLQFFPLEEMLMCSITCGFMIRDDKMKSMIVKMGGERLEKRTRKVFDDDARQVSNLGSEDIQDYEDDPFS